MQLVNYFGKEVTLHAVLSKKLEDIFQIFYTWFCTKVIAHVKSSVLLQY